MPHQIIPAPVAADGADRISSLPDGVLHDILGFLEAAEAVQTSVLARRWRDLWRFMPALRVTRGGTISLCRSFLDYLLNLRGRSNLHTCLFSFNEPSWLSDDDMDCLSRWCRYALLQEVKELIVGVEVETSGRCCALDNLRIVSQSLTKLQLTGLDLCDKSLDFSRCPALEELTLTKCYITDHETDNMFSSSLVCLHIHECKFTEAKRVRISTPNLVSLQFTDCSGSTPIFDYMPASVTAIIILNGMSWDCCIEGDPGYCVDALCPYCYEVDNGSEGCVLLNGISAATNLELVSPSHMYILKRDLRFCPTFSKLQTLLLNGWCVAGEQCALACILQHSPVLEKLTIDLYREQLDDQPPDIKKQIVPSKAMYNSMEQSFTMENLNKVEVKCHEVNHWIFDIMKSLIAYGIPLQKISIEQKSTSSKCLNFVCVGFSSTQN